ncbi:MAG: HD domain-containing protein [Anaerolineae bacterium]|nr:HD domain-containing protein [Anaerolineae bacterium]
MVLATAQRQKIANYVRSYILRTAESFGHQNATQRGSARWTHTLSVYQNLQQIMDGENASPESRDVCEVAAFFHDIDHYTVQVEYHAAKGAETAARFLKKENYSPEFIFRVTEVIRAHDRDLSDEIPIDEQVQEIVDTLSLETRMVMDADTLDKIGVSNILQSVLTMGFSRQPLVEVAQELSSGWPLQRAKLWKDMLTTQTGKRLGEERFAFYEQFLNQVAQEVVTDDPYPQMAVTQEVARVE